MLAFARETRLSETTFVQSSAAPGADYRNRIFSMAGELPFAGHPSLGTAAAVAQAHGARGSQRYVQETGAGLQPIDVELADGRARAAMLQEEAQLGPELDPILLLAAVGLDLSDGSPDLPTQVVSTGLPHIMLPLASRAAVQRIVPDAGAIDRLLADLGAFTIYASWSDSARGIARARSFPRSAQAIEDPATGSAAGPLCAYLHRHTGCAAVEIEQGVEIGRPSRLRAEIVEDRVRVAGDIVFVIDGVLTI
jgi:trans-2,3-dihydro-3-hydroxyanthranilate isomerase